ncbi:MAG: Crp/Fnr family transcriptional regulator [Deltaproteobacteria bacterium]|nr:Crp/Fnr family transcriptional regulator [Deltaproteobacteria bacterium]
MVHQSLLTTEVPIDRIPLLRALASNAERDHALRPHVRLRVLSDHETVFSEGQTAEYFHFVAKGRVKLVAVAEHGRETILELCGPGSAICIPGPTSGASYCCSAIGMEPGSEVVAVPREDVLAAVERGGEFTKSLFDAVAGRCMRMCQRVSEMAAGQVEQRLARLILDMAGPPELAVPNANAGHDGSSTLRIPVRLTRQDLADLCGTSLETAIRVMSRWTKERLIEREGRAIVILDPEALARVCRQPVRRARPTE